MSRPGRRLAQRGCLECGRVARGLGSVAVDVLGRCLGGMRGAEVGAVAAEDLDPLRSGVLDGLGDEVGGVASGGRGSCRRTPRRHRWPRRPAGGRGRRSRPGRRGRWWRRRARRAPARTPRAVTASPLRPVTARLPSSPSPVTVQVSRLATPRSRSLRRVAIRSPTPTCSPAFVVSAVVGRRSGRRRAGGRGSRRSAPRPAHECRRRSDRRPRSWQRGARPRRSGRRSGRGSPAASKTSPGCSPVRICRDRSA